MKGVRRFDGGGKWGELSRAVDIAWPEQVLSGGTMNKGVAVAVADDPTQLGSRVDFLISAQSRHLPLSEEAPSRRPQEEGRRS